MRKLKLSIATEDYDHFRDFRLGGVQAEGIEPIWLMPAPGPNTKVFWPSVADPYMMALAVSA